MASWKFKLPIFLVVVQNTGHQSYRVKADIFFVGIFPIRTPLHLARSFVSLRVQTSTRLSHIRIPSHVAERCLGLVEPDAFDLNFVLLE